MKAHDKIFLIFYKLSRPQSHLRLEAEWKFTKSEQPNTLKKQR